MYALFFGVRNYRDGLYGYNEAELVDSHTVCKYLVCDAIYSTVADSLSICKKRLSILQADPIPQEGRDHWLPLSALISASSPSPRYQLPRMFPASRIN